MVANKIHPVKNAGRYKATSNALCQAISAIPATIAIKLLRQRLLAKVITGSATFPNLVGSAYRPALKRHGDRLSGKLDHPTDPDKGHISWP